MANNIQKLIKLVNKKLNEYKAFNDVSTKFENVVKKTRNRLTNVSMKKECLVCYSMI